MCNLEQLNDQCYHCPKPSCTLNCPVHQQIPTVLKLYAEGKRREAFDLVFKTNPLMGLCGPLCPHEDLCAKSCPYYKKNHAIIPFYLVEVALRQEFDCLSFNFPKVTKGKVAIIGAGPAGLASAIRLKEAGFSVDVYEKEDGIGGIIRTEIPEYRYHDNYLDELYSALKKDITFYFNKTFGKDILLDDLKDYQYILLACGCTRANTIIKHENVLLGSPLLRELKKGLVIKGKKIAVLGCGHIALDVAGSLKRMGNDVTILYRRLKQYAPVTPTNMQMMLEQGIGFRELLTAYDYKDGKLYLRKMTTGPLDASGRPSVVPTDEVFTEEFDLAVEVYGSDPDYDYLKQFDWFNRRLNKRWLNSNNYQNIYFVGDYYNHPTEIAKAIGDGFKVANCIINGEKELARLQKALNGKNVVFGGSFNPLTIAHQEIIDYLLKFVSSEVSLLPNGDSYTTKQLLPFEKRVALIRLIYPNIKIDDYETRQDFRGTYQYLKDHNHPFFVIGSDSFKNLTNWINGVNLVKENNFIVFVRDNEDLKLVIEENQVLKENIDHFYFLNPSIIPYSASSYRSGDCPEAVDGRIDEVIRKEQLF